MILTSQTVQIIATYKNRYVVADKNQLTWTAIAHNKKMNFACGDWVEVQQVSQDQAVIKKLHARKALLYRSDKSRAKLIAANVTQAIIVVAVYPSFSDELIARSLIAAEAAQIKSLIVLNKMDLVESHRAYHHLKFYQQLNYPMITLSAQQDISTLRPLLKAETSILIGQSGMGKSTIINALFPEKRVAVNGISTALDSGKHTTTNTHLFQLSQDTALIDSPGMQSFGLNHIPADKLIYFMPDMRGYVGQCRFHNCQHRLEPNCAIQVAVAKNEVLKSRLEIYHRIKDELMHQSWRG